MNASDNSASLLCLSWPSAAPQRRQHLERDQVTGLEVADPTSCYLREMEPPPVATLSDIAVIGAGAAGFMAAISAREAGASVTLYNSHAKSGLKILMSGGTRCNVTHVTVENESFHGGSRNAIGLVLKSFPAGEVRRWFETRGVALKEEPGGKLFPVSDSARTVVAMFEAELDRLGVRRLSGHPVTRVDREGYAFRIETAAGTDAARAVILTTGGHSYPRTGSDGSGYRLAASLGHTIEPTTPALTPLVLSGGALLELQGLTLPAALTLRIDGRRVVTRAGSLLVTHFGLSGPAALDMSRHWLRAPAGADRRVSVHWRPGPADPLADGGGLRNPAAAERAGGLPDIGAIELEWLSLAAAEPRLTVAGWLGRSIPARLARELIEASGLATGTILTQVPKIARRQLIGLVTDFPLDVVDTKGYARAEVTAGGVPLAEIDPRRMMSRRTPGFFLAGEVIGVDGRLGGYNFQWAWSSGRLAGIEAARWVRGESPAPR